MLGNDVVDLADADNRASAANPRFADRVLSDGERRLFGSSAVAPLRLWALWAAKEAVFKALAKRDATLPFVQRAFEVSLAAGSALTARRPAAQGAALGAVTHGAARIAVRWRWTAQWLHCETVVDNALSRVCALDEDRPAPDAASAAVRRLAVGLLARLGVPAARIDRAPGRGRGRPPHVVRDERVLAGCEVSLSHDGRFVAAAVSATPQARLQR
ncbi:MAG: 4'-phosphopantetheinyl transferase superfamily protein [Pseudomonadota bacterium]